MALTTLSRLYPCSTFEALLESSSMKNPLLRQPSEGKAAGPDASALSRPPDTMKMSLDEWVAYETRTCSHSRAAEAARRIRAAQQSKGEVLDLYRCHLHSVPPLVGLQHVTYYKLTTNYLMKIPDDLGDLPNLTALCVSSNGLRTIPPCSKYSKLKTLEVGGNPVHHVPSTLLDRKVTVYVNSTLVGKFHRKQFHTGQKRIKVRNFLRYRFPWLPERFLPQLTDDMPTFDGGNACDRGMRPFPYSEAHITTGNKKGLKTPQSATAKQVAEQTRKAGARHQQQRYVSR